MESNYPLPYSLLEGFFEELQRLNGLFLFIYITFILFLLFILGEKKKDFFFFVSCFSFKT